MKNNYKYKLKSKKFENDLNHIDSPCCEGPNLTVKDGVLVCSNCGIVRGENLVDHEKRAYSFEEINERQQNSPRWREFGPRTIIPITHVDSKGKSLDAQGKTLFLRLSKIQNSLVSSIERNYWESKPKLNQLASKLAVPEHIKETAWKIYTNVVKKKLTMGRSIDGFVAASLYAAIRIHEFPRLLEDVSDASLTPRHTVVRTLSILLRDILPELSMSYKPITAKQLVYKFGNELNLPMETQNNAINILARARIQGISYMGKDPKGVAASVIYLAAKANSFRRTQSEIANVAKITEVTLRNRINELRKTLKIDFSKL